MTSESGYEFQEKGHKHLFNGKRMTGVTTILSVIAKPFLINWAANMAVDYIKEHSDINEVSEGNKQTKWLLFKESCLDEARKAHIIKRDTAGDIGKTVHLAIEEYIKNKIEPELDKQGMKMFEHFRKWEKDNNVKFIESEKHLYSEKLFLGGILDLIVEIDGQLWIADIKTGGVYPEAFFQMAAYQILLEEMKEPYKITGHIILGLKKDGTFEEKRSISCDEAKEAFMSAYNLYKITQKINQLI